MGLELGRRSLLLSLGALAGCAGDAAFAGEFDAAAAGEIARRPSDYVNGEARAFAVSRDGRPTGLLWGTFHIAYDETTVMPRAIRQLFSASSSLSVESVFDRITSAELRAFVAVTNRGLNLVDAAALERLDGATRRELEAVGLPSGSLEQHSLIGLSRLVAGSAVTTLPGSLPQGQFVDATLIGFARSVSIPVRGLENADAGLMERIVYADPNGEEAAAALRLTLRRRSGIPAFMAWLRRRYAAGEVGAMLAGLVAWRSEAVDLARHDRSRTALLTERNAAWMPRLEAALGEPGAAFIVFGAAHLMGADGVVALLRARGWEVSACVGDRCAG